MIPFPIRIKYSVVACKQIRCLLCCKEYFILTKNARLVYKHFQASLESVTSNISSIGSGPAVKIDPAISAQIEEMNSIQEKAERAERENSIDQGGL